MKDQSLEQAALTALQVCQEKVPFLQMEGIERSKLGYGTDFQVRVRVQDRPCLLLAQVKNNGQPRIARMAVYELKDQLVKGPAAYGIFIAPYISPDAGRICEEAGIGYLDMAGNCLS